jgi:hypothetical protein
MTTVDLDQYFGKVVLRRGFAGALDGIERTSLRVALREEENESEKSALSMIDRRERRPSAPVGWDSRKLPGL